MTATIQNRRWRVTASAALLMASLGICSSAVAEDNFSAFVDADGNISLPDDFRNQMVHLGSWFVPDGPASGFHDVYTSSASVDAYRQTGEFPDGATLVKELRASQAADYTTGKGVHHATSELKQWFVMVKNSSDRFADDLRWGDGWGWALFKPDDPSTNLSTDYKADCLGCHVPAQSSDLVYIEAYPTLRGPGTR